MYDKKSNTITTFLLVPLSACLACTLQVRYGKHGHKLSYH